MKRRGLLENIKFDLSNESLLEKFELREGQQEIWDKSVIAYIKDRGSDENFRKKIKNELSKFKSRRGPKSEVLTPLQFFHLIQAIKIAFKLRSIDKALEKHCEISSLPPEKVSLMLEKYNTGRKENLKKG